MSRGAIAEFVEYSISMRLLHFRVDVEARITQFRDFLRE